jgi:hypothetical protein
MAARPRVTLDGALWVSQCILAFWFSWIGSLRALVPIHDLERSSGWIDSVAAQIPVRTVGGVELILSLLVIVPSMTRFWPRLAPLAAIGLASFAACGVAAHLVHGEWARFAGALVLTALGFFVAWGRLTAAPIPFMRWTDEDPGDWPAIAHRAVNVSGTEHGL